MSMERNVCARCNLEMQRMQSREYRLMEKTRRLMPEVLPFNVRSRFIRIMR